MKVCLSLMLALGCMSQACGNNREAGSLVTNYTNPADVVSYIDLKSDADYIASLRQTHGGLKDEKALDLLLQEENYIEVLNHLWSETDPVKKLQWLEKKASEGHTILMLELAEEYCIQNPTPETYAMQSMPWVLAGVYRCMLDAACSSDKSVSAAATTLQFIYQERILTYLLSNYTQEELSAFVTSQESLFLKRRIEVVEAVLKPFLSGDHKMPSPCWVFAHGMGAFIDGENAIPEKDFASIRNKMAERLQGFLNTKSKK